MTVLPYFESQGLPMLRILTDRGSEYCGKVENCDYDFIAINDIERSKTKVKHPQITASANGSIKQSYKNFTKWHSGRKRYTDLTTLQADLDEWLMYYNHHRTHQGKNVLWQNTDGNLT